MADRQRDCPQCGSQFSYTVTRGSDRKYCTDECKRAARAAHLKAAVHPSCTVMGCCKKARSGAAKYCEMHYGRLRRNGGLYIAMQRSPELVQSHGYIREYRPDHPLSDTEGYVYQHRRVLHDHCGDGPFNCHVCGAEQAWQTMDVDHLNGVKDDNRPENLAPACPKCNRDRAWWAAQAAARRRAKKVVHDGVELTIGEAARLYGLPEHVVRWRLGRSWTVGAALTTPIGPTGPKRRVAQARAA